MTNLEQKLAESKEQERLLSERLSIQELEAEETGNDARQSAKDAIAALETNIANLQAKLGEAEKKQATAEQSLERNQNQSQEEIQQLQQAFKDATNERTKVEREYNQKVQELETKNAELESQLESLQNSKDHETGLLRQEMETAKANTKRLKQEIAALRLRVVLTDAENGGKTLQAKVQKLEQDLQTANTRVDVSTEEIDALKAELQLSKVELDEAKAMILNLHAEIREAQSESRKAEQQWQSEKTLLRLEKEHHEKDVLLALTSPLNFAFLHYQELPLDTSADAVKGATLALIKAWRAMALYCLSQKGFNLSEINRVVIWKEKCEKNFVQHPGKKTLLTDKEKTEIQFLIRVEEKMFEKEPRHHSHAQIPSAGSAECAAAVGTMAFVLPQRKHNNAETVTKDGSGARIRLKMLRVEHPGLKWTEPVHDNVAFYNYATDVWHVHSAAAVQKDDDYRSKDSSESSESEEDEQTSEKNSESTM